MDGEVPVVGPAIEDCVDVEAPDPDDPEDVPLDPEDVPLDPVEPDELPDDDPDVEFDGWTESCCLCNATWTVEAFAPFTWPSETFAVPAQRVWLFRPEPVMVLKW